MFFISTTHEVRGVAVSPPAKNGDNQVIMNADDLGKSDIVNDHVFQFIHKKTISSATILANGDKAAEAIKIANSIDYCSVGVHLNITEGPTILRGNKLSKLLSGSTYNIREVLGGVHGLSYLADIHNEFCAQIEFCLLHGLNITHLDSHHHIHTHPLLFPIIKKLQIKYNIKALRLSRNFYFDLAIGRKKQVEKKLFNQALRRVIPTVTTDYFTDLISFVKALESGNDLRGIFELYVHPGDSHFKMEEDFMNSAGMEQIFRKYRLISYKDLLRSRGVEP